MEDVWFASSSPPMRKSSSAIAAAVHGTWTAFILPWLPSPPGIGPVQIANLLLLLQSQIRPLFKLPWKLKLLLLLLL